MLFCWVIGLCFYSEGCGVGLLSIVLGSEVGLFWFGVDFCGFRGGLVWMLLWGCVGFLIGGW